MVALFSDGRDHKQSRKEVTNGVGFYQTFPPCSADLQMAIKQSFTLIPHREPRKISWFCISGCVCMGSWQSYYHIPPGIFESPKQNILERAYLRLHKREPDRRLYTKSTAILNLWLSCNLHPDKI